MNSSDVEAINHICAGRHAHFEHLVKTYGQAVIRYLRYLGTPKDRLDDLFQEIFLKVFIHLDSFDVSRPFLPWLLKITKNDWLASRRKSSPEVPVENMDLESQPSHEEQCVQNASIELLLCRLKDEERLLLELRVFQKASFSEISDLLGKTENALRVQFYRLLIRLEAMLPPGGRE